MYVDSGGTIFLRQADLRNPAQYFPPFPNGVLPTWRGVYYYTPESSRPEWCRQAAQAAAEMFLLAHMMLSNNLY